MPIHLQSKGDAILRAYEQKRRFWDIEQAEHREIRAAIDGHDGRAAWNLLQRRSKGVEAVSLVDCMNENYWPDEGPSEV
jgi:hypothetical protein